MRPIQTTIALVSALSCLLGSPAWGAPPEPWPAAAFQRGIAYSSWDGTYPHRVEWSHDLDRFAELGVGWIQVMTFARQPAVDRPEIRSGEGRGWPAAFVDAARARGFRVFLKPHVWSPQFYDGSRRWRGSIVMPDEASWRAWFQQYRRFLLAEAKQASAHQIEMLSVGLEYVRASERTADWRALIAEVRAIYPGLLTYSADRHELGHIVFWDALDVIGVNAYFPLSEAPDPTAEALASGWRPWRERLATISRRYGRPIVLTEIGYPSYRGGAATPWRWPRPGDQADAALQARAYESAFAACARQAWCGGMYWWKWYERPERNLSHDHDYSPRGKPAEVVLRRWYRAPSGSSRRSAPGKL